jgi:glycosyltransferase involved in cell wall biosynthesis
MISPIVFPEAVESREAETRGIEVTEPATSILYVAHDPGRIGGAERQLLELFKGLDRKRFRPLLVCLEPGGPVAERAEALGVPVRHLPRKWRWDLSVAWRLRGLIAEERVAIVHGYLGLPGLYGTLGAKLAGAKAIATIRIAGPRRRVSDASERVAFFLADCIVSNSKAGADYYFRRWPGRGKTRIIYNGYVRADFDGRPTRGRRDLGLPDGVPLIGHVANLTYLKDYPTFLRALAIVFKQDRQAVAVIVGTGEKSGDYEALARDLGIAERTLFLGARNDVLDLVSHFDVCVLASHGDYSEGLSNSIAEYLGLSKPVVATAVGGNLEMVQDGVTGFLTPPGRPEPLAERVLELLRGADLRQAMGARGRQFFEENLTLERMVSETQAVYDQLLGQRRGR